MLIFKKKKITVTTINYYKMVEGEEHMFKMWVLYVENKTGKKTLLFGGNQTFENGCGEGRLKQSSNSRGGKSLETERQNMKHCGRCSLQSSY